MSNESRRSNSTVKRHPGASRRGANRRIGSRTLDGPVANNRATEAKSDHSTTRSRAPRPALAARVGPCCVKESGVDRFCEGTESGPAVRLHSTFLGHELPYKRDRGWFVSVAKYTQIQVPESVTPDAIKTLLLSDFVSSNVRRPKKNDFEHHTEDFGDHSSVSAQIQVNT